LESVTVLALIHVRLVFDGLRLRTLVAVVHHVGVLLGIGGRVLGTEILVRSWGFNDQVSLIILSMVLCSLDQGVVIVDLLCHIVGCPSTYVGHPQSLDLRQVPLVSGTILHFDAIMGVVTLLAHLSSHHGVFLCYKGYRYTRDILLTKSLRWHDAGREVLPRTTISLGVKSVRELCIQSHLGVRLGTGGRSLCRVLVTPGRCGSDVDHLPLSFVLLGVRRKILIRIAISGTSLGLAL
jgi:hypothetical protein